MRWALLVVIGLAVVAAAGAGTWLSMRDRAPNPVRLPSAGTQPASPAKQEQRPSPAPGAPASTSQIVPPPLPAADRFTHRGVVQDAAGYAIVRSAPTPLGLSVARVENGETFATFPQSNDWWRVRTASGAVGYLPAAGARLLEDSAAAAPVPRAEARSVERPASGPRINRRNSANMRAFCAGAGRGTPQCRIFVRQLRNQGR